MIEIFISEGWHINASIWQIDAFSLPKFFSLGTSLSNLDLHIVLVHRPDDAADLSVVKPDLLTNFDVIEKTGQRNSYSRRRNDAAIFIPPRRFSGERRTGHDERFSRF